jgi:DNA-binding response OmpR family regulator
MSNKMKILIADDDPGILDALTMMLEDAGYEVKTTTDGKAVQNIYGKLPDLVLLDIWMSGMDGKEICKHLKSQEVTKHIPIIMISANKDTQKIALECGADDFIAKPFQMKNLLQKIAQYQDKN